MNRLTAGAAAAIAFTAGFALWYSISLASGKREPWDDPQYWAQTYPAAVLVCAALGGLFPRHAWLWPLVLFVGKFVAMCVRNGELGSLWPLGLTLFGVLALPGIAFSLGVAWLRNRFAGRAA